VAGRPVVDRVNCLAAHIASPELSLKVAELGCEVVAAPFGSVVTVGPDGGIADFATNGVPFERRAPRHPGAPDDVLEVIRSGRRPFRARVDDDPCLVGLPRDHGEVHVLAVPLAIGDEFIGALWLARPVEQDGFTDDEEEALDIFAAEAALVLDNARLRAEATALEPALTAVKDISHALLEGRPTNEVLLLAARSARQLLGAALTAVAIKEPSGHVLVRVADGHRADEVQGRRLSPGGSATGDVMRTRRSLVVADVAGEHGRHDHIAGVPGIGPAVLVPMVVGERVFGTFSAMNLSGSKPFSAEDLLLVQALAAEAALALDHERIRTELDRLALLEERERIAMELHDGVVQALFVVGLSLQAAERVADDADQMRLRLGRAIDSIDRAIRDLRNYIFGLGPAELGDRHLERALREVIGDIERSGRVSTSVELDPRAASALAPRSDTVIQAAREALTNAVKHSDGDQVGLRFVAVGKDVLLEVSDNGRGFDVDALRRNGIGHGLTNLQARAEDLGGVLEIDSSAGEGTRVRVRVPI
jgi:signal transduction histidine kinase